MLDRSTQAINKQLVQRLRQLPAEISAEINGHRLIYHADADSYFYINHSESIGEGAFGKVYKAVKINPDTGQVERGARPVAVKVPKNQRHVEVEREATKKEMDIQQNYFSNTFLVQNQNSLFIFTELLTAHELFKFQQAGDLQPFSLDQRLDLIEQIMLGINVVHHDTLSTGKSTIHKDLKPENIMISVGEKGEVNAYIIDFGAAHQLEEDNPLEQVETRFGGTPTHLAPEVLFGKGGVKSDMFSLVPVFAEILGAENAVRSREEFFIKNAGKLSLADLSEPLSRIKFNFEGMWNWVGFFPPNYYEFIQNSFQQFLEKMAGSYDQRPSSDDGLRFIIEIKKFSKLNQMLENGGLSDAEKESIKSDIEICKAKIEILNHGLWNEKVGKRKIEKFTEAEIKQFTSEAAVPSDVKEGDDYRNEIRKNPKQATPSSYMEVDRTIGDVLLASPEIAPLFSDMLKKNNWELSSALESRMEKIADAIEAHPVLAEVFGKYNAENLDDDTVSRFERLLNADPDMKSVISSLQSQRHPNMLDIIETLARNPEANQLIVDIAEKGQLNRTALLAVNYAKDKPELLSHIKEVYQNSTPDEANALAKSVVSVALVAKELAENKGSLKPERLVELTEKLFEQRQHIPKAALLSVFKDIVEQYVAHKESLNNAQGYEGFMGRFGINAYTNQQKSDAAKELIDASQDPTKKIALEGALDQGKLGVMAKMIDEVAHQPEISDRRPS